MNTLQPSACGAQRTTGGGGYSFSPFDDNFQHPPIHQFYFYTIWPMETTESILGRQEMTSEWRHTSWIFTKNYGLAGKSLTYMYIF